MTTIATTQNNIVTSTKSVNDYVVEFNQFAIKTANAVIEMAHVVFCAKRDLGADFEKFCGGISFSPKSSAIRKLIRIGERAEFLMRYAEKLPSTWTTVYRLTQLTDQVFEEAIRNEEIKPAMTGLKAGEILARQNGTLRCSKQNIKQAATVATEAANDGVYEITLRFDGIPDRAKVQSLEVVVNAVAATTGNCNVMRSQPLEALMKDQPQVAA